MSKPMYPGSECQTVACCPGGSLAQLRHPELDRKPAAGCQVTGGVAEARDLFGLSQQVGDRVSRDAQPYRRDGFSAWLVCG